MVENRSISAEDFSCCSIFLVRSSTSACLASTSAISSSLRSRDSSRAFAMVSWAALIAAARCALRFISDAPLSAVRGGIGIEHGCQDIDGRVGLRLLACHGRLGPCGLLVAGVRLGLGGTAGLFLVFLPLAGGGLFVV